MTFSSVPFFIFFTSLCAIVSLTNLSFVKGKVSANRLRRFRHLILLVYSYIFYGWWDWRFCFLMLFVTLTAFVCANHISCGSHTQLYTVLGVVVPLIVLGVFKYFNFFLDSFAALFGMANLGTLNIILPVGISFYTFQSMSYTLDIRRKLLPAATLMDLMLYISFFPQLVAGPIVKAADFLPQLQQNRNISLAGLHDGVQIFLFGLVKKVVLADHLSVFVDDVFFAPAAFHSLSVILAVLAYALQIYFDFSGYSDMAIGCAKVLGYDLQPNFNLPYLSRNPSEFWKRWHISLSSWLQQYLYFPLGGNRKGTARTYLNLMITMTLGGLWHGASWNFVLWGFLHGMALCAHKFVAYKTAGRQHGGFATVVAIGLNSIFVCFCWIFFRAPDMHTAWVVICKLVIWSNGVLQLYSWFFVAAFLLLGATCAAIWKAKKAKATSRNGLLIINGFYPILDLSKFWSLFLFFVIIGLVAGLAYTGGNPFIYFQF